MGRNGEQEDFARGRASRDHQQARWITQALTNGPCSLDAVSSSSTAPIASSFCVCVMCTHAPSLHRVCTASQDEDRIRAVYRMRLAMWLCRCRRVRMLIHRNLSSLSGYQVSFIQVSLYTRCVALQGEAAPHPFIASRTPSRARAPIRDGRDAPRAHTRDTVFAFAGTSPDGA